MLGFTVQHYFPNTDLEYLSTTPGQDFSVYVMRYISAVDVIVSDQVWF